MVHAPLATVVSTLLPGKRVKQMQDSSTRLSLRVCPGEGSGALGLGMQQGGRLLYGGLQVVS